MSAEWLGAAFDPARRAVVQAAMDKVGYCEMPRGSNRSPSIDRWNAAVGAPLGSPWCASFASSCRAVGGASYASGSCEEWHRWALAHGAWKAAGPVPGDVVLFDFTGSGTSDHCGIVVRTDQGGPHTVQGNTDDDGSREGYIVLYKDMASRVLGYVSWAPV